MFFFTTIKRALVTKTTHLQMFLFRRCKPFVTKQRRQNGWLNIFIAKGFRDKNILSPILLPLPCCERSLMLKFNFCHYRHNISDEIICRYWYTFCCQKSHFYCTFAFVMSYFTKIILLKYVMTKATNMSSLVHFQLMHWWWKQFCRPI